MKRITAKQQSMLDFIESFISDRGYPPTYEEMRVGLHLSTKSLVDYHLTALEKANRIERDPDTPRGIRIVTPFSNVVVGSHKSNLGDLS